MTTRVCGSRYRSPGRDWDCPKDYGHDHVCKKPPGQRWDSRRDREHYELGASDERAAIVAWLRKQAVRRRTSWPLRMGDIAREYADAIERGEHLTTKEPTDG